MAALDPFDRADARIREVLDARERVAGALRGQGRAPVSREVWNEWHEAVARAVAAVEQAGGQLPCARCARTGHFITHVENGQPRGPGGICFRCAGKGYQTRNDARRNVSYDFFGIRVE